MFGGSFRAELAARGAFIADARQSAARESNAIRLHMLARDTKDARDQLDALTRTDVLSIANMIEEVGKAAGIKVKIGDVLSGSSIQSPTVPSAPADPNALALHDTVFLIETDGSFPSLMHAVVLLEQLPLISSIQDLELRRTSITSGGGGMWHATIHIHALSTTLIPA